MNEPRAFVAGAGGVVGRILCRLLIEDGWHVTGATRSSETRARLNAMGVHAVVVDVFDRHALARVVIEARPGVVVHQLTDLPREYSPEAMAAGLARTARLRETGTRHLVAAAVAAGASRLVAQSIAFAYAPGVLPSTEASALDETRHAAVAALERCVLGSGLDGIVLRYGRFYGPGTWTLERAPQAVVHVDAAADAARRAMTLGRPGAYNIVEDDDTVTNAKARRELDWHPDFRVPS